MKRRPSRVRLIAALATALFGVLATQGHAESGESFGAPVTAIASPCGYTCFEPTVAVDNAGRIFVTVSTGGVLAVSADGGRTFTSRRAPPVPVPVTGQDGGGQGDAMVQVAPSGRIYYSAVIVSGAGLDVMKERCAAPA